MRKAPPGRVEPPAPGEPWTVMRLVRWSADWLGARGVERPRLDVELLLAEVLEMDRLQLYLQFDRPLQEGELARFRTALRRRGAREPLQYILGRSSFRQLLLRVDRRGLIPRPETEELVEAVLAWARERAGAERGLEAVDIGTGTGAIALSLATEGPFQRVVATDISPEALSLARENVEATLLPGEVVVELREGDLLGALRAGERFDVVVSNPPYVADVDWVALQPEVRDWEPRSALTAGPEGIARLEALVWGAPEHLRPGGLLALEVGAGQGGAVAGRIRETGRYGPPRVLRDLAGIERIVLATAEG